MKQKYIPLTVLLSIILGASSFLARPTTLLALPDPSHSSTNYGIIEYYLGSGGHNDLTSASYSARATLGEMAVGNVTSTNYQVYSGFETTDDIYLELVVTGSSTDLGVLDSGSTATATGTFYVRSYLSEGYSVTSAGLPTSENGDIIASLTSNAAATAGVEQFGINLVANTSPTSFGADPVQVPSGGFSFGQAASNYDTANSYRYNEGEQIAFADSSSGETDYTVSYILNISGVTEAGQYTLNHSIVATATF